MTRPEVTVVVRPVADPAATVWAVARLRPTLRFGDVVIVAVGGAAAAPIGLPGGVRWDRAVEGEDAGAQLARIAAGTASPLLAELHADVTVTAHWLDDLAGALHDTDDPSVRFAGPRSNLAPPGQHVQDAGHPDERSLREFVRAWRATSSGVSTVQGAVGAFARVGRTAEIAAGGRGDSPPERSLVVHRVYVHHAAAAGCPDVAVATPDPGAPLLSASLIVKDEEAVIASCIEAVWRFADEVVVYDTGSTDRTREIAAGLGATVIDGYWDEDFGAARNRSLAHCRGEWILAVDADEIAEGDPAALRGFLAGDGASGEGYLLTIHNLTMGGGVGATVDSASVRLFRRDVGRWNGRLHEQAAHARLGRGLAHRPLGLLGIRHSGYLPEVWEARNKSRRNLDLAYAASVDAAARAGDLGGAVAAVNLARSVHAAGDSAAALPLYERAWEQPLNDRLRRLISTGAYEASGTLGRMEQAADWLDRLAAAGELPAVVVSHRGRLAALRGSPQEAVDLFETLPERARDGDGVTFERTAVAAVHARMLWALDRADEAVGVLLCGLRAGVGEMVLREVVALTTAARRPLTDLVAELHPRLRRAYLAQCLQIEPSEGDLALEAFWQVDPTTDVLAVAASLASLLPVLRALEWSARLRGRGLTECPLVAVAGSAVRTPRDRVLAAAVAWETFADERALALLEDALAAVPDDDGPEVLEQLALLAPGLARAIEPAPSAATS